MVSLVAYYIADSTVYLLLEQATGGKLYNYIRSYNRHSSKTNPSIRKSIPIKLPVKSLIFKSHPIEIPETPISQLKVSEAKSSADEDTTFSFYDLLQSYYGDDKTLHASKTSQKSNPTELIECKNTFEEAPHFNMIANDLDVNNILNCSKKLLNSVSSTLKRVQTTTEPPSYLCNDTILTKSSNSIESLDQNNDENDEYMNILTSTYESMNTKEIIKSNGDLDDYKLFDVTQIPQAIIKRWFREIIFAVKHLHANEIVCYDLQPKNLLLGKNGEILLSYFYRREFDLCSFGDELHQTCYPSVHIAPERPLTGHSDVWSIGVIFYELLTGYSFKSCHPDGILSHYDIQYPENFELDSRSKDLIEGVRIHMSNCIPLKLIFLTISLLLLKL